MSIAFNEQNLDKPVLKIYPYLEDVPKGKYQIQFEYMIDGAYIFAANSIPLEDTQGELQGNIEFRHSYRSRKVDSNKRFNILNGKTQIDHFETTPLQLSSSPNHTALVPLKRGRIRIVVDEIDVSSSKPLTTFCFNMEANRIKKFSLFSKNKVYGQISKPIPGTNISVPICATEIRVCGDRVRFANNLYITDVNPSILYVFSLYLAGKKSRLIGSFDLPLSSINSSIGVLLKEKSKVLAVLTVTPVEAYNFCPPPYSFLRCYENGLSSRIAFVVDCANGSLGRAENIIRSVYEALTLYSQSNIDISFFNSNKLELPKADKKKKLQTIKGQVIGQVIDSMHSFEPNEIDYTMAAERIFLDTIEQTDNDHLISYLLKIIITDASAETICKMIDLYSTTVNEAPASHIIVGYGGDDYSPVLLKVESKKQQCNDFQNETVYDEDDLLAGEEIEDEMCRSVFNFVDYNLVENNKDQLYCALLNRIPEQVNQFFERVMKGIAY